MKILPPWLANWPEIKDRVNQFLGQPSYQNAQDNDQVKAQPRQRTNHSRRRSNSIEPGKIEACPDLEGEFEAKHRSTSEEPDARKRKYLMVNIEELKQEAEVRPDKAASPASPVEVANIFDLQKRILSTRKVKSADKKCKEAFSLVQSNILSPEQLVAAWDKAKQKRLAAASDAPRCQFEEKGPYTQIQHYRDEHARKQQEADEAYRRQVLQVNPTLEQDHMGKVKDFGVKPISRLHKNDPSQDTGPKNGWVKPQANAHAGRHLIQSTPQTSAKRQKIDNSSSSTNASSQSPTDLDGDQYGQQRHSSLARSGHSQTLNESTKNRSGSVGGVQEYRAVEEIANPRGGNHRSRLRHSASGGSQKFKDQKVPSSNEKEDANDPIVDSDSEPPKLRAPRKNPKIEVQIPACQPEEVRPGSISRTNRQHDDAGEANSHENGRPSSSGSKTSTTSPYFPANSTDEDSKSARGHRTTKHMSAAEAIRTGAREIGIEDAQLLDPDLSLDELTSMNQLTKTDRDRQYRKTAQILLQKPNPDQGRHPNGRQLSMPLEESDSDDASTRADIKPTNFSKTGKKQTKSTETKPTYDICQLFDHAKVYLRETDNKVWCLEHNKEKNYLQPLDDKGMNGQLLMTKPFNSIEFHEESCKVVIHRHFLHQNSNATQIYVEFTSQGQCAEFTSDMIQTYKLQPKNKQKDWLDRAFIKAFAITQNRIQPSTGTKRPREEEEPEDIQLAKAKSARRHAEILGNAMRAKTDESAGRSIQRAHNAPRPTTRGLAASMKSDSIQGNGDETTRHSVQNRPLLPATFYGDKTQAAENGIPHGTRSSTRLAGAEPTPPRTIARRRTPPPEVVGWTKANPNWVKEYDWRKSIVYPPTTKNRTTVEQDDIERLDEGEFLNDSLVGFYLGYLEVQLKQSRPDIAKRIYFQNSFFFKRLSDLVKGSKDGINYAAVEKWTSKVDIFEYDYIIVPVNENLHWYVAIICHPSKLIGMSDAKQASKDAENATEPRELAKRNASADVVDENQITSLSSDSGLTPRTKDISLDEPAVKSISEAVSNGLGGPSSPDSVENRGHSSPPPITSDILPPTTDSQPKKGKRKAPPPSRRNPSDLRIITLDSFHLGRSPCCTKLKRYLIQELRAKKNIEAEDPGSIGMTAKNIPYQDNSSDCGLFLLNYVAMFIKDPEGFIKDILQNSVDLTDLEKYPTASTMPDRFIVLSQERHSVFSTRLHS